jgi:hydroxyacid-oxoacid transhydrogenase
VPGKLKPMIAIPTTTGTGSETTGTAVFDYEEMNAKTAIAHRELRPLIGLIDPENVRTIPPNVVACSGLDVLCHGLESYTAIPFHTRNKPETPSLRPSYQGSNPISDIWSLTAVKMVAKNIYNAVNDPDNHEARSQMLLAATYAGIGFGNAGCHLCHGMSYAVSGNVKEFFLNDYPQDHPMIPHGLSVAITAPAIFNFTAKSAPKRHVDITKALGISDVDENNVNIMLPRAIKDIMNSIGMPTKLSDLGYKESDVNELVKVTLPQHRVVKLSPIEVDGNDLKKLFIKSLDDSWIQ